MAAGDLSLMHPVFTDMPPINAVAAYAVLVSVVLDVVPVTAVSHATVLAVGVAVEKVPTGALEATPAEEAPAEGGSLGAAARGGVNGGGAPFDGAGATDGAGAGATSAVLTNDASEETTSLAAESLPILGTLPGFSLTCIPAALPSVLPTFLSLQRTPWL